MCGIAGVISPINKNSTDECRVMLSNMVHRGPDDEGLQTDLINKFNISLGHRRLSIIELSELGHQPMCFEHLTLIFNGEIYNYKEIKIELELLGYSFFSNSDTEVVLKAYHMWGSSCFHKFNGMWAIAILDKKFDKLILCRDRVGVKPLYWFKSEDVFVFASELKALAKYSTFRRDLCPSGMSLYFQFGYIKEPFTIYKGVYKLEAGSTLEVSMITDLPFQITKYWSIGDLYQKDKIDIGYKQAKVVLEEKMHKAFQYRMVSEVPVGVLLSGGYDSSALAAILQSSSSSKIETFTIGFNSDKFNEAPNAKKIAAYLGTSHNELYFNENELERSLNILPEVLDEPFADASILPTLLVSSFARRKVTVALSADGGDELFCGYPVLNSSIRINDKLKRIPHFIKTASFHTFNLMMSSRIVHGTKPNKFTELLRSNTSLEILEIYSKSVFSNELGDDFFIKENSLYENYDNVNNDLDLMLLNLFKTYLNNNVLHKLDLASMYHSLESREPFLDKDLVEYVVQLPNAYKMDNNGTHKLILKDLVHDFIPQVFFNSKKMGFSIPPSELNKFVNNNFDYELLKKLVKENVIFDVFKGNLLKFWRVKWNLYIFLIWYKTNIEEH
jgi:asparagine synthase (glutamine-hydrolysing)